jgi:drug/metabolite transporter (DMT)-like permease
MSNLVLYLSAVLIWGSTWIAITFQFGKVPPTVSVAYRFALASLLLFGWCLARRLRLRFSAMEQAAMALQGLLLFGFNYVCVYVAETQISSGLVAVVFSLIVFLNIVGARLFFGTPVRSAMLAGAVLGVGGVALIFLPEFRHGAGGGRMWTGLSLALVGTVSASLGNLLSARNQRRGLPVVQLNAYGMLYGALLVGLYAWLRGEPFVFDGSARYLLSIGYLALFGSVLAFGAYLTLVGRIGADRAAYATVVIPVVALVLSGLFEGFRWQAGTVAGIGLCLAGNVLVLRKREK